MYILQGINKEKCRQCSLIHIRIVLHQFFEIFTTFLTKIKSSIKTFDIHRLIDRSEKITLVHVFTKSQKHFSIYTDNKS